MGIADIVSSIDREIATLRKAREVLSAAATQQPRAGRALAAGTPTRVAGRKKRRLSPEGRRRISEAVKRRWEKQRKSAAATRKEAASK